MNFFYNKRLKNALSWGDLYKKADQKNNRKETDEQEVSEEKTEDVPADDNSGEVELIAMES